MALSTPYLASGHVFRRQGARGDVWYAKYRVPGGQQVKRRIGPAWTARGRPAPGFFTKRTAEAWLSEVLEQARRGELAGMVRTGATAASESPLLANAKAKRRRAQSPPSRPRSTAVFYGDPTPVWE
jgi:hypothetical protein